jgi:hypothetical protein
VWILLRSRLLRRGVLRSRLRTVALSRCDRRLAARWLTRAPAMAEDVRMPSLWRRTSPLVLSLLVLGALLVGLAGPTASPAAAAVPNSPGPAVVIHGSGWGHSVGMSQYGARVMAQQSRTATQILQHYYPGTSVGPDSRVGNDKAVSVDLFLRRPGLEGRNGVDLRAIGATSASGRPTSRVVLQMPDNPDREIPWHGPVFWVGHDPARKQYVLHEDGREIASAPDDKGPVRVFQENAGTNPGIVKLVNLASADSPYIGTFRTGGSRGGALELSSPANAAGVRDSTAMSPVLIQPMQSYLWGIAEVPGSWERAVLEAQAITARTYAGRIGGVLSATPAHQAYAGYHKELVGGPGWPAAVNATSSVAVTYAGGLAQTYYSSSHGLGRSENSEDSWAYSAAIPYLRSVDDPFSAGGGNPYNSWKAVASNEGFAAVLGLARVSNVRITSRTAGGSPKALQVDGWTPSGERVSCTWTGGAPCASNDTRAKGAGARLRVALPLLEGGSGGRLRSQQIASITIAPFGDDEDSVHQYNIGAVSSAGITSGCGPGAFCPDGIVNRGQMASFLARSLGLQPDTARPDAFADIATSPHRGFINALARGGRVGGYADGTYRPVAPVSREQIATFLVRAFDLPPAAGPDRFDDIAGSFHRDNINAAAARGIAGGCSATSYCPTGQMTRGQMATFLARAKGLGE